MDDKDHISYAQKFWDAANLTVTAHAALSFGTFAVFVIHPDVLPVVQKYFVLLLVLATVGNLALLFVLYRLYFHEARILASAGADKDVIDSVWSALHFRWGILGFISALYVLGIGFIWWKSPNF